MNAHGPGCLSHQFRKFIESVVLIGSQRQQQQNDADPVDPNFHALQEMRAPDELCICQSCLELVSQAHSAESDPNCHDGTDLVLQQRSPDRIDDDFVPRFAREVSLSGFSAPYLARLEKTWLTEKMKPELKKQYSS